MRDDPMLGMGDKLFLEEHRVEKKLERDATEVKVGPKVPGAVHLSRRVDYLISVLTGKDQAEDKEAPATAVTTTTTIAPAAAAASKESEKYPLTLNCLNLLNWAVLFRMLTLTLNH